MTGAHGRVTSLIRTGPLVAPASMTAHNYLPILCSV